MHTSFKHLCFVLWTSPSVIMGAGWPGARSWDGSTSSFKAWFNTALSIIPRTVETNTKRHFRNSTETLLCNVFPVSLSKLHKLGPVCHHSLLKLWNYEPGMPISEHCPKSFHSASRALEWLFCLIKREKEQRALLKPFSIYSWVICACQSVKDPSKGQEITDTQEFCPQGVRS